MLPAILKQDIAPDSKGLEPTITRVLAAAPFLSAPTVVRWSEVPMLYRHTSTMWLLTPAERDPVHVALGGFPVPARALRDLTRVAATGAHFDRIAIAHEIPTAAAAALPAKDIPASGVACTDEVARKLLGDVPPPSKSHRLAARLDRVAGAAAATVGALGAGAAAALAGSMVDPIVFGVVGPWGPPRAGEPAAFFALTAWEW